MTHTSHKHCHDDQHHHVFDRVHVHLPDNFNGMFALAVALNLIFVFIEGGYALSAHSMSLLADAGHNLADVFVLLLAWGANWLSTLAGSERFSYGYKRTTILAALINGLLLIVASGVIAYASFEKLMHPTPMHTDTVIIVALLGIAINGGTALLFRRKGKNDLNVRAAFLHLAYDALISATVVVTAILVLTTGLLWLDPLVGMLIVITILIGTWQLLRNSLNLILDAIPHTISKKEVNEFLHTLQGVTAVHDLHIWGLSTREIALTAHLVMPEHTLMDHDYEMINATLLSRFNINHVTLQVEKGAHADPCGRARIC